MLGRAGYCASKYALHGFFETLGAELDGQVAVHLVCPGFTDTGLSTNALDHTGQLNALPRVEVGASANIALDPPLRSSLLRAQDATAVGSRDHVIGRRS